MSKLRLTGRKAVLVGLTAAAASATVITVAAPASAAPSQLTSCSETVRVRSQPNESAPVIGSCQAGERVTVDGTRNGFAHLVNKRGWASLDFVRLRDADGLDDVDFDGDSRDNKKDKSCSFTDSKYHYDGDDRYKCRNGKRDYDDDYNRRNNNDNNDNNDNNKGPLGGLLGN
jgi:hypothetical protein